MPALDIRGWHVEAGRLWRSRSGLSQHAWTIRDGLRLMSEMAGKDNTTDRPPAESGDSSSQETWRRWRRVPRPGWFRLGGASRPPKPHSTGTSRRQTTRSARRRLFR